MAAWAVGLLLLASGLESDLNRALANSGIDRRGLGVAVGRAGDRPVLAIAAREPRIPASNQKILTAAAAIHRLGEDFRFTTTVAKGPNGELVVIGEGDPNLSGRFFGGDPTLVLRRLAADVRKQGVARVEGGVVLDASRFDDDYVHPDWPANQLQKWYCAPVAALVYNDCWDVTVRPGGRAGAPALVEVQPALLLPAVLNRCATVSPGVEHVVHIGRGTEAALEVRGRILTTSQGVDGHVTVGNPVRFFGEAFVAALEAEGIEVKGGLLSGKVPDAKPIVVYRTSLERTLPVMLGNSQNLYAECTLKRLGQGSFESGARAVHGALRDLGVETDGLVVRDGSGLARTNRVTALALYQALQSMRKKPVFRDALAKGGEGTLRKRYKDLGGRIRAKTGYIRGVSALSGYVEGRQGGHYVFSILANGSSVGRARKLQDLIVMALARAP
jgi:D-alanyl-D-alanine carboxypeptidase/D-alanyl-D-alanine-endopeptidase (penicillin-binding protein 4)